MCLDEPGVAWVGRLVEPLVLVVGLVGRGAGRRGASALIVERLNVEAVGDLADGEQAVCA